MKNGARILLLFIGDIGVFVATFFLMIALAFPGPIEVTTLESHLLPFSILSALWLTIFFIFNLYNTQLIKPTIPHLQRIGIAFFVCIAVSVVFFYTIRIFGITPKTNLLIFGGINLGLFLLWRRIFYTIFASFFKKGVAFIIPDENKTSYAQDLIAYISTYPQSGFMITGIFHSVEDFFVIGNPEKTNTLIVEKDALVQHEDFKLLYGAEKNVYELAYAYEDILAKIPTSSIGIGWFLHNIKEVRKVLYEYVAGIIGMIIALLTLAALSPFLLLVALAITIDDGGPIFYKHIRVGKNGQHFTLYKFRSMVRGADTNGAEWTEKNDPRITRIGRIIRRLHIDEVPQLWNIIRGDILLVGPRPELPSFVEKLEKEIPYYALRHIITPGFTGWAQIKYRNARGIAESKEKFEYDLYYIKNRNIFMDIGILLRTIIIIFTHD